MTTTTATAAFSTSASTATAVAPSTSPVRIIGATPVHSFAARPRQTHAPSAAFVAEQSVVADDETFWVELESTLRAREAAKAAHPSSLGARLRIAS